MSKSNNGFRLEIPKELMKERDVPKFNLSSEEAKKICEENGVIWGVQL